MTFGSEHKQRMRGEDNQPQLVVNSSFLQFCAAKPIPDTDISLTLCSGAPHFLLFFPPPLSLILCYME